MVNIVRMGDPMTRPQSWIAVGMLAAAGLVVAPFLPWIVLALWLGLYARRVHGPLARRLGGRDATAAVLTVSLLLIVALPIAAIITSIVIDLVALVRALLESEQARAVLVRLVESGGAAAGAGGPSAPSAGGALAAGRGALDLLMAQGDRAWAIGRLVADVAAHMVVGLLVMVTGMYGVLMSGPRWYAWLERHGPLAPAHLARYGAAFVETGRGLWFGIVGAGLLQSIVATAAFLVLGVPSALALGLLTLLLSVVPAIGTALVWAPVAAGLAVTGRTTAAIALAVVGVSVIGTVDNVARPWLARRGELALPTWAVLISMFGGIELIGGWGVLFGPLALRLAKEALLIARPGEAASTQGDVSGGAPAPIAGPARGE